MAEKQFEVRKVTAVPTVPTTANTLFLVAQPSKPAYVELYVSDKTGQQVKRVITEQDVIALINATLERKSKYSIVEDINARNQLTNKSHPVYVKNATGDSTVRRGGAFYLYDETASTWIKTAESESMDMVFRWVDIEGKPNSTPTELDNAVAQSHTHANQTQLDLIGQNENGQMTYNGKIVATTINDAW